MFASLLRCFRPRVSEGGQPHAEQPGTRSRAVVDPQSSHPSGVPSEADLDALVQEGRSLQQQLAKATAPRMSHGNVGAEYEALRKPAHHPAGNSELHRVRSLGAQLGSAKSLQERAGLINELGALRIGAGVPPNVQRLVHSHLRAQLASLKRESRSLQSKLKKNASGSLSPDQINALIAARQKLIGQVSELLGVS